MATRQSGDPEVWEPLRYEMTNKSERIRDFDAYINAATSPAGSSAGASSRTKKAKTQASMGEGEDEPVAGDTRSGEPQLAPTAAVPFSSLFDILDAEAADDFEAALAMSDPQPATGAQASAGVPLPQVAASATASAASASEREPSPPTPLSSTAAHLEPADDELAPPRDPPPEGAGPGSSAMPIDLDSPVDDVVLADGTCIVDALGLCDTSRSRRRLSLVPVQAPPASRSS